MITKAFSRVTAPLAVAAALTLGGCATMSPVQTDVLYQPADGINLNLGEGLIVRGLVVIGEADADGPGRVSGQFINNTGQSVAVTFHAGDAQVSTSIPAWGSVNLADEDDLTFEAIPAAAGDLLPVAIRTATAGDNVAQVPVVLGGEGIYADFTP